MYFFLVFNRNIILTSLLEIFEASYFRWLFFWNYVLLLTYVSFPVQDLIGVGIIWPGTKLKKKDLVTNTG